MYAILNTGIINAAINYNAVILVYLYVYFSLRLKDKD